jgi:hypothetical protein
MRRVRASGPWELTARESVLAGIPSGAEERSGGRLRSAVTEMRG